jgi:hypothetical protein
MLVVVFHIARLGRNSCKKKTRSKCKTTIGSGEGEARGRDRVQVRGELLLAGFKKVINVVAFFSRNLSRIIVFIFSPKFCH